MYTFTAHMHPCKKNLGLDPTIHYTIMKEYYYSITQLLYRIWSTSHTTHLIIIILLSSMLSYQLYSTTNQLRWIERLKPFYEAYTGPCHDHYCFWPGFLLLVRTGLFIMNSLVPSHIGTFFQIKMLITAVSFVLIISLACISLQKVAY